MGTCRESERGCLNTDDTEAFRATEVLGSSPVPDQVLSVGVISTGGLGSIAFLHQRRQAVVEIHRKQDKKGSAQWKEEFARGVWLTEVRKLVQSYGGVKRFTRSLQVRYVVPVESSGHNVPSGDRLQNSFYILVGPPCEQRSDVNMNFSGCPFLALL